MASSPATTHSPRVTFALPSPQKMSITQTFYLAHKARSKLSNEAARSDHNLRLLVGHANLLDCLMVHISETEAEQEKWYNSTVRGNEGEWEELEYDDDEEKYGSLPADYDSDTDSSDSDDSDYDLEEPLEIGSLRSPVEHRFLASQQATVIGVSEIEDDSRDDYEDDEDDDSLSLTRTYSHRPPSLCSDSSDDEDESNPTSPEQPSDDWQMYLSQKERIKAVSYTYFGSDLHTKADIHHGPTEVFLGEPLGLLPEMISSY